MFRNSNYSPRHSWHMHTHGPNGPFDTPPRSPSVMSSASSSGYTLPPLHEAIPEFHSYRTFDRAVPRTFPDRHSPDYQLHRHSPVSSERGSYDAHTYPFPGGAPDYRHTMDYSNISHSSSYSTIRASQSVLPIASLTSSSRGSSLDMDPADGETMRSQTGSSSSCSPHSATSYARPYENDPRYSSTDYRYSQQNHRPASPPTPSGYSYDVHAHSSYYSNNSPYAPRPDSRPPGPSYPPPSEMEHYEGRDPNQKRRRGNLPKPVTDLLRSWLHDHINHPYPTEEEKQMLMAQTGLTIHQISNWFINARRRRVPAINGTANNASDTSRTLNGGGRRLS